MSEYLGAVARCDLASELTVARSLLDLVSSMPPKETESVPVSDSKKDGKKDESKKEESKKDESKNKAEVEGEQQVSGGKTSQGRSGDLEKEGDKHTELDIEATDTEHSPKTRGKAPKLSEPDTTRVSGTSLIECLIHSC